MNRIVLKILLIWFAIIVAESVHGTLRQLFLAPVVGDFTARRIAFFTGLALIFAIVWVTIRRLGATRRRDLYLAGAIWMIMTLAFEIVLGRLVMNLSWERIAEDYDVTRGGLMAFGLVFLFFVPTIAAAVRGCRPKS